MTVVLDTKCGRMKSKRLRVSRKRQITIPKRFYDELNMGDEVECFLRKDRNEIVIRPVREETEFAEEILEELVSKGLSGQELIAEFKRIRAKIRPAVERMIEDAERKVRELKGTGDDKMKELFSDVED